MAESTDDIRSEVETAPEELRAEMDQTRSSLTEKLEALEDKVVGTVQAAQSTVEDTITSVKETVHETVQTVKRTFDLRLQTEQRPWLMVGGAVATGFVVGRLIGGGSGAKQKQPAQRTRVERFTDHNGLASPPPGPGRPAFAEPSRAKRGWMDAFMSQFGDEVRTLRAAGIGALMGMVRDFVKDTVPAIAPQVERAMDSATNKLGGDPVRGPVLQTEHHNPNYPIHQPAY